MTKKKTPSPVSKAAAKKKIVGPKPHVQWKHFVHTGEYEIPVGAVPIGQPPAGETRICELEAENYALKTLLSKHQSESMPQAKEALPQRATMLSQFAEQLDGQLSRLYNSLNTLDALANRLLIQKEDGIQGNAPEAHDLSTRYSNLLSYFSNQNDRLDFLNTKLSDLI